MNQISSEVPEKFSLSQNYPNPFNPTTTIRFAIPSNVKSEMSNVKIIIYDVLGREVQTLVNENLSPGTYEVDFDGSNLPSGIYYYTLNFKFFYRNKKDGVNKMKTFKFLFLLPFLILTFNSNTYSQSGNFADFFPLQVGNVWVYQHNAFGNPPCYCNEKIRVKVTGTIVNNGKTYFQSQVSTIVISCPGGCGSRLLPFDSLLRVDSASAKVLRYAPGAGCITPNETLMDSLKARLNDTIWVYCQHPVWYSTYICSDTNNITIFGTSRQARRFYILGFEGGWARTYVKGIGLTGSNCYAVSCNGSTQLLGCVVNGILYGDTSFITGVNQISTEIPEKFSLSQNYPNPFNPTTTIRFAIPSNVKSEMSNVKIIIYDVLGREVQILVNENLIPGTYEVDFDGSNLPSGVYYYKLEVSDPSTPLRVTETRKMVLIK